MVSNPCAGRWQRRKNFAADDLEAFGIWRHQMEARVASLEQAVQELRRINTPIMARRGERQYLALLREYLSEDESRELAFRMSIDWETLPGDSKRGKLLSLVQELERQGRLYQFEDMVREIRPHVDWPPFV